jgi:hypothetical protein
MKKVGKITNTWKKALELIKSKQVNEAVEKLDECLLILAIETENGTEKLDGHTLDLWKMRVWVKLEDLNVIPAYDAYI